MLSPLAETWGYCLPIEEAGKTDKLLWKLFIIIFFSFLHCSKLRGIGLRLLQVSDMGCCSVVPTDFQYLAVVRSWLCHKLWPRVSLLLCHFQQQGQGRIQDSGSQWRAEVFRGNFALPYLLQAVTVRMGSQALAETYLHGGNFRLLQKSCCYKVISAHVPTKPVPLYSALLTPSLSNHSGACSKASVDVKLPISYASSSVISWDIHHVLEKQVSNAASSTCTHTAQCFHCHNNESNRVWQHWW